MKRLSIWLAAAMVAAQAVSADEVTDTLQSAIEAYESGDLQYALEELTFAQQLLNEMKSGALQAFMPEAPLGWTREIDSEGAAAMQMFGGGTGTSARYTNESTNDSFSINIITDSPMIAGMAGLFGNAAVMASQGKLVRVGREKFLQQNNQLTGMIDGRIMVQAEGKDTETMIAVLESIDFRALGRFGL